MDKAQSLEEDQMLLDAINRGDHSAANRLVEKYQDRLYLCILKILDQPEDAMDVVQDAFISALKSINNYKGKSQFFTWLYRIAINAAINHQRKWYKQQAHKDRWNHFQTIAMEERAATLQPLAQAELVDEIQRVRRGLEILGPDYRAVLVLKEAEDLDYQEIADILKIPIGTVRSRLHRARQELRWILEQRSNEDRPTQGKVGNL